MSGQQGKEIPRECEETSGRGREEELRRALEESERRRDESKRALEESERDRQEVGRALEESERARMRDKDEAKRARKREEELRRALEKSERDQEIGNLDKYLVDCHLELELKFTVDPGGVSGLTNINASLCPWSIGPWRDFMRHHAQLLERVEGVCGHGLHFPSAAALRAQMHTLIGILPAANQSAVDQFAPIAHYAPVMNILRVFLQDPEARSEFRCAGMNFAQYFRTTPAQSPTTSGSADCCPDGSGIRLGTGADYSKPFVYEQRAPLKFLPTEYVKLALQNQTLLSDVLERCLRGIVCDGDRERAEHNVVAAILQEVRNMVTLGHEYGFVDAGQCLVFLHMARDTPKHLEYHLCIPSEDVKMLRDGNLDTGAQLYTAVAQLTSFCLMSLKSLTFTGAAFDYWQAALSRELRLVEWPAVRMGMNLGNFPSSDSEEPASSSSGGSRGIHGIVRDPFGRVYCLRSSTQNQEQEQEQELGQELRQEQRQKQGHEQGHEQEQEQEQELESDQHRSKKHRRFRDEFPDQKNGAFGKLWGGMDKTGFDELSTPSSDSFINGKSGHNDKKDRDIISTQSPESLVNGKLSHVDENGSGKMSSQSLDSSLGFKKMPPPYLSKPYCTQACLLSLKQGASLDENCPNVHHHRATHSGNRHPIDFPKFTELFEKELCSNIIASCRPFNHTRQQNATDGWQKFGRTGILFQLELVEYGYSFVGKGIPEWPPYHGSKRHLLEKEGQVYTELDFIQGKIVPVYLGIAQIHRGYRLVTGERVWDLSLMSWAGVPLTPEDWDNRFQEISNSFTVLEAAGVVHYDRSENNVLWNEERRRFMVFDFDVAIILPDKERKHLCRISELSVREEYLQWIRWQYAKRRKKHHPANAWFIPPDSDQLGTSKSPTVKRLNPPTS